MTEIEQKLGTEMADTVFGMLFAACETAAYDPSPVFVAMMSDIVDVLVQNGGDIRELKQGLKVLAKRCAENE